MSCSDAALSDSVRGDSFITFAERGKGGSKNLTKMRMQEGRLHEFSLID